MADGNELTGTIIYIQVDPNTFTWQAVNLALNGEAMTDTAPIKVAKPRSGDHPQAIKSERP
jgi:hypothetical protein